MSVMINNVLWWPPEAIDANEGQSMIMIIFYFGDVFLTRKNLRQAVPLKKYDVGHTQVFPEQIRPTVLSHWLEAHDWEYSDFETFEKLNKNT